MRWGDGGGDAPSVGCGDGLSFQATTQVATAQGEQAISTLQVGEQVWSYNPQTKKMELEPIQKVWLNHDNDLVDLTLITTVKSSDGKNQALKEVIHTNEKHPFLTKEKGFIPVSQLKPGMHVLQANGSYGVVAQLIIVSGAMWMYNLTVAQDHTFTVGIDQWVVHNDLACGIHSTLPYNRDALGEADASSRGRVLLQDPDCVYCEDATPSTSADHVPSLKDRWESGEYDNMTYAQIRADVNNPDRMCGACSRHNSSKGSNPIDIGEGGWDPTQNGPSMDPSTWL